jgi:hypothetical protein
MRGKYRTKRISPQAAKKFRKRLTAICPLRITAAKQKGPFSFLRKVPEVKSDVRVKTTVS